MGEPDLLRVAASLLLVLGLLLALGWVARRNGWMRPSADRSALKVCAMQRLGARSSLAIVEVDDARLVLGITSQQITLLHTLPPADHPPPADAAGATDFSAALGRFMPRR